MFSNCKDIRLWTVKHSKRVICMQYIGLSDRVDKWRSDHKKCTINCMPIPSRSAYWNQYSSQYSIWNHLATSLRFCWMLLACACRFHFHRIVLLWFYFYFNLWVWECGRRIARIEWYSNQMTIGRETTTEHINRERRQMKEKNRLQVKQTTNYIHTHSWDIGVCVLRRSGYSSE